MAAVGRAIGGLVTGKLAGGAAGGWLGSPWGFLLTTVASIALSIGLSYLQKPPAQPSVDRGVTGKLRAGGTVPRSFVVGERWGTPGSLVYANTWGDAGGTPNARLFQVIELADLPGADFLGLTVNGETATYNPAANTLSLPGNPLDGYVAIPEYDSGGGHYLAVKYYDGTQTAADAGLVLAFGSHPDHPYQSTRVGTGIAYIIVAAYVADEEGFPWSGGFPEFKFILGNHPFYDPRKDTTAGGSGAHRFNDPSTWEPTGNPAVMIYNILRGITYGGAWFYGLQNVHEKRLPYSDWAAAMNECDVLIAKAGGGTEPQYRAAGEIFVSEEPASVVEKLLKSCNGRLSECGGIYKLKVGAAGAAVFSFDDGAILSTDAQTFDMFPSIADQINGVTARYVSEAEDWELKDAPPRYFPAFEAADGGWRRLANATYEYVSNARQVQRLMLAAVKEARKFRKHTLPMPPEARVLEPLDVVSWTSVRNGYSAKKFRIDYVEYLPNLDVILSMTEVDPADYDWSTADELPAPDGTIKPIKPAPQPIKDFAAAGAERNNVPGILLSWDPAMPGVNGVRFQVRRDSDDVTILDSQTDAFEAGALFISHNLVRAMAYEVRAKYRSATQRPMSYSGWLPVTTPAVAPWDPDIADIEEGVDNLDDYAHAEAARLRKLAAALSGAASLFNAQEVSTERLKVTYQDFTAEVNAIRVAAASDKEVLAGEILTLDAKYSGAVETAALALQSLTARVVITEAGISTISQALTDLEVRMDDTEGIALGAASTVSLLEASVSELNGVVVSHASLLQSLSAQVGESTAQGRFAIQATADQSGARARLALMLRAATSESYAEAGLYLEAVATPQGNVSQIAMKADRFSMISTVGGVSKRPFAYADGKLQLGSDVEIIGNLNIKDGTITVDGMAIGSMGDMDGVSASGSVPLTDGVWVTKAQLTLETRSGGGVSFVAPITSGSVTPSVPANFLVRIRRSDGVVVKSQRFTGPPPSIGARETTLVAFDRSPLSGSITYQLQLTKAAGVSANSVEVNLSFNATAIHRGIKA